MPGVLLAPLLPLALGVIIMRGANVPTGAWLLNVTAAGIGLSIAMMSVMLAPIGVRIRRLLPWLVLIGLAILGTTLLADDTEGVSRWLSVGPVRVHAGAIVLPVLLVALLHAPWTQAAIAAITVQVVLLLQPDAAQAAAFCTAWIVIAAFRQETRATAVITVSILLAGATLFRADPLEPVPHVEGIIGLGIDQAWGLGAAALISLASLPLALVLFPERRVGIVLATYTALLLIAAGLGNHPVPVLGYGVSPILGYYGAVSLAGLLRESRVGH